MTRLPIVQLCMLVLLCTADVSPIVASDKQLSDVPFVPPAEIFEEDQTPNLIQFTANSATDGVPPGPVDVAAPATVSAPAPGETPLTVTKPAPAAKPAPAGKPTPPVFPGPKTLPPTGPWKPLYFQNDFSYKQKPGHTYLPGEELKDIPLNVFGETLTVSAGGEIRHRYMSEDNRLRPGGPLQTDYNLWRWRQYVDVKHELFRVYAEGIEADSFGSEGPDLAIDVDRWELLNLFVDVELGQNSLGSHTVRYGRQELLFGRQRLISPLDWANTRRNFEGGRYMLKADQFTFDAFLVHPVNSATGFNAVADFDSKFNQPNYDVWFGGLYHTYTGLENSVIDTYWLLLDTNLNEPSRPDGLRHLLGTRWAHLVPITDAQGKELRVWDFDAEGGIQTREDNGEDVLAGFFTAIAGHTWKAAPWTPRVAGLFYYGSGDRSATGGHDNTFNTLFPLGHAYWGLSDNLSGQNLYDWSTQVDVKPTQKLAMTAAYHWFALASNGDSLYNVAGAPVGAPGNGRDVGQALDVYGYYSFNPNFDVQIGYSKFWYGDYIDAVSPRGDASQFYVQTSFRY